MKEFKFPILFSLLFLIINIIRLQNFYACIHDDYYIFLRYADNFINGFGFVFNPLGERVEGFSSFLYLSFVVLLRYSGFSNHGSIPYLGIFFSSLSIIYLYLVIKELVTRPIVKYLILILLILNPIFIFNSTTGMDTSLFTFLILASIYYFLKFYNEVNIKVFFF